MSEANQDRPLLMIYDGKMADQQWTLLQDAAVIGRGEECDLVLQERQVSRQHIRIYREDDGYFIEDLESKNGTWVNGHQLKGTRRLADGDEINLALVVKLRFVGSGSTAPLPFEPPTSMTEGRLRIEPETRRVFVNDVELDPPLSPPQYRLLELLFRNAGRICTRDDVVATVWPDVSNEGVSEQAIDALVRRLRDRLSEADPEHQYIVTVRGHGFRLEQNS